MENIDPTTEADHELILQRLGEATLDVWAQLPRDIQQIIFETAVTTRAGPDAGDLRQRVAAFLHENKEPDMQRGNRDVLG